MELEHLLKTKGWWKLIKYERIKTQKKMEGSSFWSTELIKGYKKKKKKGRISISTIWPDFRKEHL